MRHALITHAFAIGVVAMIPLVHAAEPVSAADRNFVAMVSQGGMFEVEAGAMGAKLGTTQDVRDLGNTEQHDHTLVGEKLISTAHAAGLGFPATLNSQFSAELAALKAAPAQRFDSLFLEDMNTIHAKDGAAFAKEEAGGTNPGLRAFAAESYRIVQRHIGALNATGAVKN